MASTEAAAGEVAGLPFSGGGVKKGGGISGPEPQQNPAAGVTTARSIASWFNVHNPHSSLMQLVRGNVSPWTIAGAGRTAEAIGGRFGAVGAMVGEAGQFAGVGSAATSMVMGGGGGMSGMGFLIQGAAAAAASAAGLTVMGGAAAVTGLIYSLHNRFEARQAAAQGESALAGIRLREQQQYRWNMPDHVKEWRARSTAYQHHLERQYLSTRPIGTALDVIGLGWGEDSAKADAARRIQESETQLAERKEYANIFNKRISNITDESMVKSAMRNPGYLSQFHPHLGGYLKNILLYGPASAGVGAFFSAGPTAGWWETGKFGAGVLREAAGDNIVMSIFDFWSGGYPKRWQHDNEENSKNWEQEAMKGMTKAVKLALAIQYQDGSQGPLHQYIRVDHFWRAQNVIQWEHGRWLQASMQ
jgi:hypothetical protein